MYVQESAWEAMKVQCPSEERRMVVSESLYAVESLRRSGTVPEDLVMRVGAEMREV